MKKVFIILLNWNNWSETKECLDSLERVDYPNFEVLTVDNSSNEDNKKQIREFHQNVSIFPPSLILRHRLRNGAARLRRTGKFHVLWNSENLGFAGGNNVGIKYALEQGADYIMVLNNDTVVAPDFLNELVKVAENNPTFGILGSRIYKYGANEIIFDGGRVNKWLNKGGHITSYELPVTSPLIVDYITGAAMLIKREVIEKVGLMREEYFLYYEDVDWCIRARKTGYKCVLVPTSKVWHKVSATNKEGSPSYIYYHTRNSLMLAKWNGNIFQKFAAYMFGAWILLKQAIKFIPLPSKRVWAKAMARGVLDFYFTRYGKYK